MDINLGYDPNEEISTEDFLKDEREAARKARAEKKRRKHYKFSDKEVSKMGLISCGIALLALVLIILSLVVSTKARGNGGESVGYLGGASFVVSLIGIIVGLLSFRQTDVFLASAWVGVIANGMIWLFNGLMIIIGL